MFDRLDIPGGARARVARFWAGVLLGGCLLGPGPGLRGELVSSEQAATAVSGWLRTEPAPLREPLSGPVKQVEEFKDKTGASLYYVVYLEPAGFVVVPAEDTVEPMVAFASAGRFDPSLANPLGALVSKDLAGRVGYARGPRLAAQDASMAGARQKWQRLAQAGQDGGVSSKSRAASVPDVRVAPLTSSRWGQTTTHWGYACYNSTPRLTPLGTARTIPAVAWLRSWLS